MSWLMGSALFHHSRRLAMRANQRVLIMDAVTGGELTSIDFHEQQPVSLDVSADDQWLAVGLANGLAMPPSISIVNLETGQIAQTFATAVEHDEPLRVEFSADGKRLLAVLGRAG